MASYSVRLSTGGIMPLIGLGTWQAKDEKIARDVTLTAIKEGYRHIDTAFVYGNEKPIGDALQTAFSTGLVKREEMFIVTKLPGFGHNPDKLKDTFMKSLTKLQLSYIDLYLIHFPIATKGDENNPFVQDEHGKTITEDVDMVDTWKAMEKLVDEGLAKAIGLSNYNSVQIKTIYDAARIKPANLQVECNVYFQQEKLFSFCKNLGITFTAYAPVGSPGMPQFVKENYKIDIPPPPNPLLDPVIIALAEKHNKTAAQICLRFLVQRGVVVIPKSASPQRIKENFQIFDFQLTDEEMSNVKKLDKNERQFNMDIGRIVDNPKYPYNIPF